MRIIDRGVRVVALVGLGVIGSVGAPAMALSASPSMVPTGATCHDAPPPAWLTRPAQPGDGIPDPEGRIVFGAFLRDDPVRQQLVSLYAIDPDGSDLVQLLDCETLRPRFSPDGSRVVFGLAMDDGSTQVATMAVDGTDVRILTDTPGYAETPAWSPDGSWLVYSHDPKFCRSYPECVDEESQSWTLWRMEADGSDQRLLGDPAAFDWEPRLSPDGGSVVFTRIDHAHDDRFTLMIRDLVTGEERQVTANDREPEHPDWSRDGHSIIYNTRHTPDGSKVEQIELVPADDPAATPVVLYPGDGQQAGIKPAFSPDGTSIVFGCTRALCVMDADGSDVRVLLQVPGVEFNHFAWGRLPGN